MNLTVSPPIYSLILLPYITQCACERTCHGGNPGCLEWVCTDDVAKNGGVGWRARVWQLEEGGPRAPEKVRWVADRSFKQNEWSCTRMEKDLKVRRPSVSFN